MSQKHFICTVELTGLVTVNFYLLFSTFFHLRRAEMLENKDRGHVEG